MKYTQQPLTRDKMHKGVRQWSDELEGLGFTVKHKGTPGTQYSQVEYAGTVLMAWSMGGDLHSFLLGVRAARCVAI